MFRNTTELHGPPLGQINMRRVQVMGYKFGKSEAGDTLGGGGGNSGEKGKAPLSQVPGSVLKNLPANAGNAGSILGLRGAPGEGNSNPFWCSCLGNLTDREARWATAHGVTKCQTQLSK